MEAAAGGENLGTPLDPPAAGGDNLGTPLDPPARPKGKGKGKGKRDRTAADPVEGRVKRFDWPPTESFEFWRCQN